jgi:hypothetical protein
MEAQNFLPSIEAQVALPPQKIDSSIVTLAMVKKMVVNHELTFQQQEYYAKIAQNQWNRYLFQKQLKPLIMIQLANEHLDHFLMYQICCILLSYVITLCIPRAFVLPI